MILILVITYTLLNEVLKFPLVFPETLIYFPAVVEVF